MSFLSVLRTTPILFSRSLSSKSGPIQAAIKEKLTALFKVREVIFSKFEA